MMPDLCRDFIQPKDNEVGLIPSAAFENTDRISLCLANIELNYITPEINRFKFLRVIHITNNKLSQLPPEFFDLITLEQLDASKNNFSEIPEGISHLSHLCS